jgi:predicted HTH domain antitoxin
MSVIITDEDVRRSGLSEAQFRIEIALHLYAINVFTLGQAATFSQISQAEMMEILGSKKIPVHYTIDDLDYDYKNIVNDRNADYK